MHADAKTPTSVQVITAIARREIIMAMRRKLVRLLFLVNLLIPLVLAIIMVVNTIIRSLGLDYINWDPLVLFLQIETSTVLLLALGIGTPLVSRDRSEDVLFLYATRPVNPWSYTIGKMLAVAVPAVFLLVIPAVLIAILRMGLMVEFGLLDSLVLIGKVLVVALLVACGYAGVSVGPSAAAKKARWALLLALLCLIIPQAIAGLSTVVLSIDHYALDVGMAGEYVIEALFDHDVGAHRGGVLAALCLCIWGVLGALVIAARVRREMIP
jgi:ABC-type transport system involved in multi-copper enzyme maturation permease subunit